ncbi:uncharacterized protein HMPREF1541_08893 [Cyphellophora europaea CBS 101466]|uniref:Altered inheritance of mitochondria protein 32 n=1 Tax=Cyphellophora europaea (strain CBS 101466) TaxID=1220924 RepID=W2RJU2_CYPE1|nr:uncharacterized protein HMPREF1541_08893 [Cyphellophora europaea CBS 101466]ETN36615.1 hypothetical protein HMPREF1541_08893 [Cyphellophora europaea CBS 101466]
MPSGLDIDHKTPITNNIAPYTSHLLVSTGQSDWASRIEDESTPPHSQPWGNLVGALKAAFGRNGQYHSRTSNVLVTTSSLPAARSSGRTVLAFPTGEEITLPPSPSIQSSNTDDEPLSALLAYLARATHTTGSHGPPPPPLHSVPITHPTILICSHNSRDTRCGVLGPLLVSEFKRLLPPSLQLDAEQGTRVAGISHIGGHKWAGNVIVYIPRGWSLRRRAIVDGEEASASLEEDRAAHGGPSGKESPLAGKGVWYGRVEPRHVEGIINETILGGKVIRELCRGVVDEGGRIIRI